MCVPAASPSGPGIKAIIVHLVWLTHKIEIHHVSFFPLAIIHSESGAHGLILPTTAGDCLALRGQF